MSPSTVLRLPLQEVPLEKPEVEADTVQVKDIREVLSEQFLQAFDQTGLPETMLTEFVYALDHLDELTGTPNFPNDRLLNTADVNRYGAEAVQVFNQAVYHNRNKSRLGVAVGPHQQRSLDEFLELNYPATISRVLRALRLPGIAMTVDNQQYFIGINLVTAHPLFGVISYEDMGNGLKTSIPFLLDRLES